MVRETHIKMAHGAGGEVMKGLIKDLILKHLAGEGIGDVPLGALDDSAVIDDIVFTTDSHTVKPLEFPGGDIGSLSVAGTVNDISVMGAEPIALSLGMVVAEGVELKLLDRILNSVGKTCEKCSVPVVTGDTKVVEAGALESLVINTSGIGKRSENLDSNFEKVRASRAFDGKWLTDDNLKPGDKLIISGTIGDHGIALLSHREGYQFETELESDIAPLNHLIAKALEVGGVVAMKDPTRGGLANSLNEWSEKSGTGIVINEEDIPFQTGVVNACDMLGLDPMEIGNEGKVLIGVIPELADDVLAMIQTIPEGKNASIIGEATADVKGVVMQTSIGGRRIVEPPMGDPIPRIC
jgi:hydrogenase expression/formation protein HypE